ncbi:replication termination factor Rtf1 [Schizosaccharomyces japonicus yFS275]|uniref:Replication termination factor Rtf1 n=1 Tax=Schizosaccharomyces japonicus (strain yFS275 / FY16936) TaxID=402676 RepID=B6JUX4_SCHJY|nr:replication termination factor Rtf1 [Schizosaccharomyces japonicus yFS275]EEB05078.1 replication termination factor Rtf1 [Schizosaccharomyces japonicus yFS275]
MLSPSSQSKAVPKLLFNPGNESTASSFIFPTPPQSSSIFPLSQTPPSTIFDLPSELASSEIVVREEHGSGIQKNSFNESSNANSNILLNDSINQNNESGTVDLTFFERKLQRNHSYWTPAAWELLIKTLTQILKDHKLDFVEARSVLMASVRLPRKFTPVFVRFRSKMPMYSRRTIVRHMRGYFKVPGYENFQYKSSTDSGTPGVEEVLLIEREVTRFCAMYNCTEDDFRYRLWNSSRTPEISQFLQNLYSMLDRNRKSVYNYVRRKYHPCPKKCVWSSEEEEELKDLVNIHGPTWTTIGKMLQRRPMDCRDFWRDYIHCNAVNRSAWTSEECERLLALVADYQKNNPEQPIRWMKISEQLGTRHRHHCKLKYNSLTKQQTKPDHIFLAGDSLWLIESISQLNVQEEWQIDWKYISQSTDNLWSPDICRQQYKTLKYTVPNWEVKSLKEILNHIIKDMQQLPPELLVSKLFPSNPSAVSNDDSGSDISQIH